MKNSQSPFTPDPKAILEAAGTMMIACDLDGTVLLFNPAAERLLGWSAAEVVGRHTPELWHDRGEIALRATELAEELGRDISADFQVFSETAAGHSNEPREWTFIRKDGTRFPVQLVISTISDASGTVTGYLGTAQDISKRVQAEQVRDRWFNLSLDILCVSSNDGYFKRVNPAFSRILGWSEEELLTRPYLDFVHPDERNTTQQEVDKQTTGQPVLTFENRYLCKDGSWRVLSWTSKPQPDGLMFATARDVTEIRRAEEDLQKSQQDLSITLRSIGEGVIATDAERRVTRLNPVAEQLTGWREDEAVGRLIDEVFVIVHEYTRQPAVIPIDEVIATGTVKGLANHTLLISRDGSECSIADSAAPIRDDAGNIAGVVLVFRDASSEREFERELQELNADLERRVAARTEKLAKEQQRLRHSHLILESVASEAPFSDTLDLIVRFVMEEVAGIRCGILVYDEESDSLQPGTTHKLPNPFNKMLLEPSRGKQINWIWQAVQSGQRVVVDASTKPQLNASSSVSKSVWAEPIVTGDGTVQAVFVIFREQNGLPDDDETNCVECACGLVRVAIARHHARSALKASEARYRRLLENIPAPVFVYDRESLAYLAVSERAVVEYGYSREEFLQMTIADIRPTEDLPALREMLDDAGLEFEHRGIWRHRKKDGSLIDVEITTHGLELAGRSACIVFATDVTEKRRAEEALLRSKALNQAILQASLDCIVTMTEAGEVVEFNRAAEQTFGCSRAQALGRSVSELMIPSELRKEHERGLNRYLATGEERIICRRIQTTALRCNGETFPVELTVVPVEADGERLFTAFLRDMTLAIRAEGELRRTTELLQAVADGTTDAIFVKDLNGKYLLFNQAAADLTGRDTKEVLGKDDIFLFGDEQGRQLIENDRLVMQSNQTCTIEEELMASGITRSYHALKTPLRDPNGNVIGMIGISRDITERKAMESTLRANEERYRSIVEQSPDMIFIHCDNRITFINQAGIDLLGASSAEEIIGRSPYDVFHLDDHPQARRRIAKLLSEPGTVPIQEKRIIAVDGTVIDAEVQASSYYSDGKLEIQVVCRDVSERKRVEREMLRYVRHAEFSAAVGVALSRMPTLPTMLQSCTEAMVASLDAALAQIWTLDDSAGMLELRASAGAETRLAERHARVPVGRYTVGRIAAEKVPHVTNSVPNAPDISDPEWANRQGFESFVGYPLLVEERCVGVVVMYADRAVEQDSLEYLAVAANSMAQNIQRKQSEGILAEMNATLEQRVHQRTLELKENEEFTRATLDALSAHVAVVDRDGNIVATNAAWRKFAEDNEVTFQSVSEGTNYLAVCDAAASKGDTDAAIVASSLREVLEGKRSVWEHEYPCHSPTEKRWFNCQMTVGFIHQQPHAVLAHENITTIKMAQEELRDAKEKAVQASLAKSDFLAAMSHELRTPLNGILGMNALLLQTQLNDRQRRFAEASVSSGKLLAQLINDVLDLSKIEAGKLELDPQQCEIEAVVYDVVDIFLTTAQEKNLTLSCRLSRAACVQAVVDDNRLRQILVNLIGNAIKFTSTGGISIIGDRIEHSSGNSCLRIEITDTGIGIPRERTDRLFKAFSQVDSSTTRQFGGTGLGLSICVQLVSLMGGEIGAESQVGVGSTFWFEIPLEEISEADQDSNRWQSLTGTQIILVDDICDELIQVSECVTNWGCHCEQVESLSKSLDVLQRLPARRSSSVIVIGSFQMLQSDSDALQMVSDLCSGRIVALLSAKDELSAQELRSMVTGATVQKPVRPSDLFEALTSLLLPPEGQEAKERASSHIVPSSLVPAELTGHLLVAEDNRINQLYVVELLKMLGCTCDVVANGEEALSALEQGSYDLVLMDCQMPEMDGFTATREIRRREANASPSKHIPIVAVTANALTGDRERCMDAGMDAYVKKPVEGEELRKELEKFLLPMQPPQPLPGEAP